MVDEPVDHGGYGDGVSEDLRPGGEALVRGDDQGVAFVAAGNEGEEQGGGFGVEGDVSDFVDDEQRDAAESFQLFGESADSFGFSKSHHPFGGGGERHPIATAGCLHTEGY